MKKLTISGLILVLMTVALFVFTGRRQVPCGEQMVEFTYSRTQPSNVDYYNYAYSVNPLCDLLKYWNNEEGASRLNFRAKVKNRLMTYSEFASLGLEDVGVEELCRQVKIEMLKSECPCHPIKCRMTVRGTKAEAIRLLSRAVKETILRENELENQSMSWKATMDKGCYCKDKERELQRLKKMRGGQEVNEAERCRIDERIAMAEQLVEEAKLDWAAAIKAYRGKWDASIVFPE